MAEKPKGAISRREFARRAAMGTAIGSAVGSMAVASAETQTPLPTNQVPVPDSSKVAQTQLPANMGRLSPEGQAEADARFQAILARYGGRFSDEQKADLGRLCAVVQPALERVRAYPVQNGDGSALYLKPLVEREKKPKPAAAAVGTKTP